MKNNFLLCFFISIVYISIINSICFSQWVQMSSGITSTNTVTSFAVNGNILFVSIDAGGIYMTTNNGVNWTGVNNGLTNNYVMSLTVQGNDIYAGTLVGVFKSTNNGGLWTQSLTNVIVQALSSDGTRVFAGTQGYGVYMSENNGSNWSTVNNGITDLNIKSLAFNSQTFAATQSAGIFYTYYGNSWSTYNLGLTNYNLTVLSYSSNSIFFAGTSFAGIFRWAGGSTGWQAINNGLNSLSIRSIASSGGNIFAGTVNSVCVSTNYGLNWVMKNEGFSSGFGINALVLTGNYIFAGTTSSQNVWRRNLSEILTGVSNINEPVPSAFTLEQNYPNPFNPTTKIKFDIGPPLNPLLLKEGTARSAGVVLKIYDILGKEITTLVNEQLKPGTYEAEWNASDYPSGIYFYTLTTESFKDTKRMIMIK